MNTSHDNHSLDSCPIIFNRIEKLRNKMSIHNFSPNDQDPKWVNSYMVNVWVWERSWSKRKCLTVVNRICNRSFWKRDGLCIGDSNITDKGVKV